MQENILHVIASNFISGPEKQILHHAQSMRGSRYELSIASFRDSEQTPEIINAARRAGHQAYELRGGIRPAALADLINVMRTSSAAILCTHGYKANILGRFASMHLKIPHIPFVRGWTAETWRVDLYERLDRYLLSTAPHVACVSSLQAKRLASGRGAREAPTVIPNAILPSDVRDSPAVALTRAAASLPENAFIFGSFGRLSVEKGHRFLLLAFADLCKNLPESNLFLVLLGDGRELPVLQRQATDLGVGGRVSFAGFQTNPMAWMKLIDCLVQPSLTEGTPNSILEALQAGLPIVATAVGGVPDLITHEQSGLLVASADPSALARSMQRMVQSPELRVALSDVCNNVSSQYLPEVQRQSFICLYDKVLAERNVLTGTGNMT